MLEELGVQKQAFGLGQQPHRVGAAGRRRLLRVVRPRYKRDVMLRRQGVPRIRLDSSPLCERPARAARGSEAGGRRWRGRHVQAPSRHVVTVRRRCGSAGVVDPAFLRNVRGRPVALRKWWRCRRVVCRVCEGVDYRFAFEGS